MKLVVFVASLIASVYAQGRGVPASSVTITPPTVCAGQRNVDSAFTNGNYVALPKRISDINGGGCGSFVFIVNRANPSVSFNGILVAFTEEDVLEIAPPLYDEISGGVEGGFIADYNVSPLSG
ncbi:hypothetical protein VNI00_003570 [Paramarasmius palmivorus]|uniref:Uncharacterized protein n=1 Tax=Paramarasmius palmivorus TaxID=297713 RepID=A0AAW0DTL3_9AGAR